MERFDCRLGSGLKFFIISNYSGIITAMMMFDKSAKGIFVGLLLLFIALGFVLAACGDLLLLTKVELGIRRGFILLTRCWRKFIFQIHRIYRSSDASVSKAQQEFATTFLRNEHVQTATSNIAASAVRTQMANAANQPRY